MEKTHTKLIDIEQPPITERAIVVRLALPGDSDDEIEESLGEIGRLAWTAGAEVVLTTVQYRSRPCPATLIGSGKVETIRAAVEELGADLVIFDSDLSPTQGAKLQDTLKVKVVDRTQLILDIFAQRARTNEGKHQVELAQLQYALPRLTGRGVEMMRLGGGIGTRGPGEQKLEVDRRVIRQRIDRLRGELDEIRKHRRVQRKRRSESACATVALVGYTNAGKSSLLRALTGADVLIEDKLFATLDPTSRRVALPSRREAVFTDTVGFIRKLPHSLVAAFRATLEEVTEADLILLVADAAHPAVREQIDAVNVVLEEIHLPDKPLIRVYNKIDAADPDDVHALCAEPGICVPVSAHTGEGLDALMQTVDAQLVSSRTRVRLCIPHEYAGLVARLHEDGLVLSQEYDHDAIHVEAEVGPALRSAVARFIA